MLNSVERDMRINRGEVNEVRVTTRWERIRVQIAPGAIDTMGPKETARAFEMKETATRKRGIGFVAANGSGADVKKALGSVHEMSMGGKAVVLDGDERYTQNKDTNQKSRINYEKGQHLMYVWAPVKEGEVAKETEKVLKGNLFAMLATESEVHQGFTRQAQAP